MNCLPKDLEIDGDKDQLLVVACKAGVSAVDQPMNQKQKYRAAH